MSGAVSYVPYLCCLISLHSRPVRYILLTEDELEAQRG